MIRSLLRTREGNLHRNLDPQEITVSLKDLGNTVWIDLGEEQAAACEPILLETFGFHPLAVDDALEEAHIPKIDDWDKYIYLVLHAVQFNQKAEEEPLSTLELDVFLGENYLVTHHTQPVAALDRTWAICQRDERYLQGSTGRLLYKLIDELVTDYMPVIEEIDDALDQIEDVVFNDPDPILLERIFTLKRGLLRLRRILAPQREVVNKLARADFAVIEVKDQIFFRDIYDHLARLYDITESSRDLVGSTLDTYLSVVNNRMNETMKILTVITTLFMPLSFIVGFFGMNFFQPTAPMDVWTGQLAFTLTLVGMIVLPIGMYIWMRRRAWM